MNYGLCLQGRLTLMMGPPGGGKSSLLQLLAGLLNPSTVQVNQRHKLKHTTQISRLYTPWQTSCKSCVCYSNQEGQFDFNHCSLVHHHSDAASVNHAVYQRLLPHVKCTNRLWQSFVADIWWGHLQWAESRQLPTRAHSGICSSGECTVIHLICIFSMLYDACNEVYSDSIVLVVMPTL